MSLSKSQLYWLLQFGGWGAFILMGVINYTFVLIGSFQWSFIWQFGIQAFFGLTVTHFYKVYFIKSPTFNQPFTRLSIKALLDTFNITLIITMLNVAFFYFGEYRQILNQIPQTLMTASGVFVNQSRQIMAWIIIYYMYKTLERNKEIITEKLQLENLLASTELELLKTQLNPHFLFNALNSIKALIVIDAEKARDAIVKLVELLEFSLSYEKVPVISIQKEIYKVEKYLELEKIRFGNRLTYQFDIHDAVLDLQVPPALVLTLAENAIKHGITQLPDGGEIKVSSRIEGKNICIEVINSGQLKAENVKGIGLKNVRGRLKNLFGAGAEIQLLNQNAKEVLVSILYPIQS